MHSQELTKYQWENRLIVVFTPTAENEKLQKQLETYKTEFKEFMERKLVMIHSLPGKQKELLPESSGWQDSNLYQNMKESKLDYEVILIGLDGGVKLRQNEILETEKLFDLIDSMPMRKAEMQRKKN